MDGVLSTIVTRYTRPSGRMSHDDKTSLARSLALSLSLSTLYALSRAFVLVLVSLLFFFFPSFCSIYMDI